jgi:oxygen-independent coproporphyrinogen-3 oxidase
MISPETFTRYAAMRVPRYTSYPTAPHFSPAIDQREYRQWLRMVPADQPASLYLHIPFCLQMCWYCGCHTTVTRRKAPVERYASVLAKEIELVAAELPMKLAIGHVHFGGGSPTLLAPGSIEAIVAQLREKFFIGPLTEMAVEIDPRTLTETVTEALERVGVDRASIGVQTFDPKVQAAINRLQPFRTVAETVARLRRRGIQRINFDLLYGLPFQTVASCVETVRRAVRLQPCRFAVFGYAHVPSVKLHQRKIDERTLPGAEEREEQFEAIAGVLARGGYVHVGLDHFALPSDELAKAAAAGTVHRNFQGYTTDACQTLLGFGASAIGTLAKGFVQNRTRTADYQKCILDGRLAVSRGFALSEDDRRRAAIIERLMCEYRADVSAVDAPLQLLEEEGLIRRTGSMVEVTDEARGLVRVVAAAFDAYLPSSAATHALAV